MADFQFPTRFGFTGNRTAGFGTLPGGQAQEEEQVEPVAAVQRAAPAGVAQSPVQFPDPGHYDSPNGTGKSVPEMSNAELAAYTASREESSVMNSVLGDLSNPFGVQSLAESAGATVLGGLTGAPISLAKMGVNAISTIDKDMISSTWANRIEDDPSLAMALLSINAPEAQAAVAEKSPTFADALTGISGLEAGPAYGPQVDEAAMAAEAGLEAGPAYGPTPEDFGPAMDEASLSTSIGPDEAFAGVEAGPAFPSPPTDFTAPEEDLEGLEAAKAAANVLDSAYDQFGNSSITGYGRPDAGSGGEWYGGALGSGYTYSSKGGIQSINMHGITFTDEEIATLQKANIDPDSITSEKGKPTPEVNPPTSGPPSVSGLGTPAGDIGGNYTASTGPSSPYGGPDEGQFNYGPGETGGGEEEGDEDTGGLSGTDEGYEGGLGDEGDVGHGGGAEGDEDTGGPDDGSDYGADDYGAGEAGSGEDGGGGGGGECFTPETEVLMADRSLKAIVEIEPGDSVISFAGDGTMSTATVLENVVTGKAFSFGREVINIDGCRTTAPHPFLTADGEWKFARDVEPGDVLVADGGIRHEVRDVFIDGRADLVYNLELDNDQGFIAGGFHVHNSVNFCLELYRQGHFTDREIEIERNHSRKHNPFSDDDALPQTYYKTARPMIVLARRSPRCARFMAGWMRMGIKELGRRYEGDPRGHWVGWACIEIAIPVLKAILKLTGKYVYAEKTGKEEPCPQE